VAVEFVSTADRARAQRLESLPCWVGESEPGDTMTKRKGLATGDKSTAELKAMLRALREWLTNASKRDLLYRRVKREAQELEAELVALGEPLEASKPRQVQARRGVYQATPRVQMQTVDWPAPGEIDEDIPLCFHEDRGDGMPACGQPLRTWTDFKTGTTYQTYWLRFDAGHGGLRQVCERYGRRAWL
jgi:hypothetical protein